MRSHAVLRRLLATAAALALVLGTVEGVRGWGARAGGESVLHRAGPGAVPGAPVAESPFGRGVAEHPGLSGAWSFSAPDEIVGSGTKRACTSSASLPHRAISASAASLTARTPAQRFLAALRDGTLSSRSNGIPPPA
jgi:hypothetical protein